ncbi:MAG: tyrosine-type recombinase/integrase, partial [Cryobacterium sp.]|nr:tyrosine-type recombinase/integrase [Cryobacterium sp.]
MTLIFANKEFEIAGLEQKGFPLLIDPDGELSEPFFSFLVHRLLHEGGVASRKSWPTYGYALLHYQRYLQATNRPWNEQSVVGVPSVLAGYRAWAVKGGTGKSTTRDRMDLVRGLYEFALQHGLTSFLPFDYKSQPEKVRRGHMPGAKTTEKPSINVKLKVPKRLLKVLSVSEVTAVLGSLTNRTHRLMARLQLTTGIRVEELVTFPLKYVLDPRTRPQARHFFAVRLDPAAMSTKGSVERVIHVPRDMMADLWAYTALERNKRLAGAAKAPTLFVTEEGEQFATRSVWAIYTRTALFTGIHVNPHALRHT